MRFPDSLLKENLTVFSVTARDAYGNPTYSLKSIKGRWEDTQVKFVDKFGTELMSTAIVFTDTDVSTGDYIYQGVSSASTPPSSAREVKSFNKVSSVDGKRYVRKAILK